ncbi:MAG: hypothetical protein GXP25_16640 [Planctomycetes bacterium]|nr:hypothetical protein [Planctomycetota bacterium]
MPIKVKCEECGKQFVLKDEFAGKQGKCPACGESLTVPSSEKKTETTSKQKASDPKSGEKKSPPKSEKETKKEPAPRTQKKPQEQVKCPNCGTMVAKGTVVCVACGTNILTGVQGATRVGGFRFAGAARALRLLIGLGIAAAIIAVIVLVASKALTSYKIAGVVAGNERRVVKDLAKIAGAQKAFRRKALVDQNDNGLGEYGLLAELVNEVCLRDPASKLTSKKGDLSYVFATGGAEGDGAARCQGYRFRMFLATNGAKGGDDHTLGGTPERPGKMLDDKAAVELQEKSFICYAWPEVRYADGIHAYIVDQNGKVYFTKMDARPYEGDAGPDPGAAYADSVGFGKELTSGKGSDGNTWAPIPDPDTVAWKTTFVSGLLFDLNTPWFTPNAVKEAKKAPDTETRCREVLKKAELAKQRELQGDWRRAEQLYADGLAKLGKDTWPDKTLARRLEMKLTAVRFVLAAGKLETGKQWAEAREAYWKAMPDVSNTRYVEKRLLKAAEARNVSAANKAAATKVQGAERREAEAKQFLAICAKFKNPYALWATYDYYLSSQDHKKLHKEAQEKKAAIAQRIKTDPKAYPPPRVEQGKSFDLIRLKTKNVIRGKVTKRTDKTLKVEVTDVDGRTVNRLLNMDDVAQIERKEIPAAALNREEAQGLYAEAVKHWSQGMYVHALAALGKLKFYFSDAAVESDAALQKKLAGAVLGEKKLPDKLSPADLTAASVEAGATEMCPFCLGKKRLPCPYCNGTGFRAEKTRCPICNGTGKCACSVCRGTRVRQGNCGTCGTRGTIECVTCKGKGKIHPYVQCTACNGTGRTNERCPKCRGTGQNSKTRGVCQACGGSGKVPCKVCGGKGNRVDEDIWVTCRDCKGTGRIPCPNCGGTGKAPVNTPCPRCKGKGKFDCPKCKGAGRIDGKPCPLCKGARQIICNACKGVGKPICRACNGTGKETCKTCKGTGEVNVRCRHCDKNHTIPCGHCGGTGKRRVR